MGRKIRANYNLHSLTLSVPSVRFESVSETAVLVLIRPDYAQNPLGRAVTESVLENGSLQGTGIPPDKF